MLDFTIYTANCTGDGSNCLYPNKVVISDKDSFIAATKMDHVIASTKGIIAVRTISNLLTVFLLTATRTIRMILRIG